jgi:D-sedoheptulose 7-phosphate isomerase
VSAVCFFNNQFDEHAAVLAATRAELQAPFLRLVEVCTHSSRAGGTIVFFGNGGSAADAQHLAAELTVRYVRDRRPIAALALTTDSSALTAIGNDLGFDRLFARQIEAVCRKGDVCIGISTSGSSENVVQGLIEARARGCIAAGLLGGNGGRMAELCDPALIVPSTVTARIQEMHILLGQMLCGALERALGLV